MRKVIPFLILLTIIVGLGVSCCAISPHTSEGVEFDGRSAEVTQGDQLVLWMRGESYEYYIISQDDGQAIVDTLWFDWNVNLDDEGCGTFRAQLIYPIHICQTPSGIHVTWPIFLRKSFLGIF